MCRICTNSGLLRHQLHIIMMSARNITTQVIWVSKISKFVCDNTIQHTQLLNITWKGKLSIVVVDITYCCSSPESMYVTILMWYNVTNYCYSYLYWYTRRLHTTFDGQVWSRVVGNRFLKFFLVLSNTMI